MPKFADQQDAAKRPAHRSPVQTTGVPALTHEGHVGSERDPKSELFLLAISNLVTEDTFYESGQDRDARFRELVHLVTAMDPEWMQRFLPWLRTEGLMRSGPVMAAAEYVAAGGPNGRAVVASVLRRPDEPGEMLAYWHLVHGRHVPQPVKRGVADAAVRLFNESAALRYDGKDRKYRLGDVIELTHPKPKADWQSELFKYLLDRRHNPDEIRADLTKLPAIQARGILNEVAPKNRREYLKVGQQVLNEGMGSWEWLSSWLPGGMDATAWQYAIPNMGYMALLRNLRNFEEQGVNPVVLEGVARRIKDEAAGSKQFPFRFYSAWQATGSTTFGPVLEAALDASLANVPSLPGSTLILIDVSGSMGYGYGAWSHPRVAGDTASKIQRWEQAALFGVALAKRAEHADVVLFNDRNWAIPVARVGSVLRKVEEIKGYVGGGTQLHKAVNDHYSGQDRIVVITDEQAHPGSFTVLVPERSYVFNLAGYTSSFDTSASWVNIGGGLTDKTFRMLQLIETMGRADWPF